MTADRASRLALIVEDEWLIRLELVDGLQAAGWKTREAASGEEALKLFQDDEKIDLLVTDIRLGGPVDGWTLAQSCRSAHPQLGVIYASGNSHLADRQVAGSVLFAKPVAMQQLTAAAERLWQEHRIR